MLPNRSPINIESSDFFELAALKIIHLAVYKLLTFANCRQPFRVVGC